MFLKRAYVSAFVDVAYAYKGLRTEKRSRGVQATYPQKRSCHATAAPASHTPAVGARSTGRAASLGSRLALSHSSQAAKTGECFYAVHLYGGPRQAGAGYSGQRRQVKARTGDRKLGIGIKGL